MKIHEYQSKELFAAYGIPIPPGAVAETREAARAAIEKIGTFPMAVKAQIHAGGRGKGGGVKLAKNMDEALSYADSILGMTLVTPQTGSEGRLVKKVLIEGGLAIASELYLSLTVDRETACVLIMASAAGGMNIEEVAEESPEKIIKVFVDPIAGISGYHCREVAYGLGLPPAATKSFLPLLKSLYNLFVEYDCSMVEINPLVVDQQDRLFALDAKITFDSNALFRHKDILHYRDLDEEDPLDVEASKYNLNYINMDGTVGNMVNGAGLAMAVMDTIKIAGAEPANFLDVGGGATAEMIENGFRIILSDQKVKALLINIFGGILRCDVLANGVVAAAKNIQVNVPIVVRMEGTNVEEGRKILAESGLNLSTAVDLKDAGEQVAKLVA